MTRTRNVKTGTLLLLAVLAEAVILTDSLAAWIAGLLSQEMAVKGAVTFLLTYLFWGLGIFLLSRYDKARDSVLRSCRERPSRAGFAIGAVLLAVSLVGSYISWEGFKVVKELMWGIGSMGTALGIAAFIAQYVYYVLEVVLMILILSFSQEPWERRFHSRIPFCGVALAVLWGLPHILFHGLSDGLFTTVEALLFGCAFVAMKKNPTYAWPLVFLMFAL